MGIYAIVLYEQLRSSTWNEKIIDGLEVETTVYLCTYVLKMIYIYIIKVEGVSFTFEYIYIHTYFGLLFIVDLKLHSEKRPMYRRTIKAYC